MSDIQNSELSAVAAQARTEARTIHAIANGAPDVRYVGDPTKLENLLTNYPDIYPEHSTGRTNLLREIDRLRDDQRSRMYQRGTDAPPPTQLPEAIAERPPAGPEEGDQTAELPVYSGDAPRADEPNTTLTTQPTELRPTLELLPESILDPVLPNIIRVQSDTVTGTEIRDNRMGHFRINQTPGPLDIFDIYPLGTTPDPSQSRAEAMFAHLEKIAPPTDGPKKYLVVQNANATPPVMQIGRRNDMGQAELSTIAFEDKKSYYHFLKIISEYSKTEVLKLLNEKTLPDTSPTTPVLQEALEKSKLPEHFNDIAAAHARNVHSTGYESAEITTDEREPQRARVLEKAFGFHELTDFPSNELFFILQKRKEPKDMRVRDGKNPKLIKIIGGGNIVREPSTQELKFHSFEAWLPPEYAEILLADLSTDPHTATAALVALEAKEHQGLRKIPPVPNFDIAIPQDPMNQIYEKGWRMIAINSLKNDIARNLEARRANPEPVAATTNTSAEKLPDTVETVDADATLVAETVAVDNDRTEVLRPLETKEEIQQLAAEVARSLQDTTLIQYRLHQPGRDEVTFFYCPDAENGTIKTIEAPLPGDGDTFDTAQEEKFLALSRRLVSDPSANARTVVDELGNVFDLSGEQALRGKIFAAARADQHIIEIASLADANFPVTWKMQFTNAASYDTFLNLIRTTPALLPHLIVARIDDKHPLKGNYEHLPTLSDADYNLLLPLAKGPLNSQRELRESDGTPIEVDAWTTEIFDDTNLQVPEVAKMDFSAEIAPPRTEKELQQRRAALATLLQNTKAIYCDYIDVDDYKTSIYIPEPEGDTLKLYKDELSERDSNARTAIMRLASPFDHDGDNDIEGRVFASMIEDSRTIQIACLDPYNPISFIMQFTDDESYKEFVILLQNTPKMLPQLINLRLKDKYDIEGNFTTKLEEDPAVANDILLSIGSTQFDEPIIIIDNIADKSLQYYEWTETSLTNEPFILDLPFDVSLLTDADTVIEVSDITSQLKRRLHGISLQGEADRTLSTLISTVLSTRPAADLDRIVDNLEHAIRNVSDEDRQPDRLLLRNNTGRLMEITNIYRHGDTDWVKLRSGQELPFDTFLAEIAPPPTSVG